MAVNQDDGAVDRPSPQIDLQRVAQQVELHQAVEKAFRMGYQAGLRAAHAAIQDLIGAGGDQVPLSADRDDEGEANGAGADEPVHLSMEEQRRIHSRALRESGPPAAGETELQRQYRLQCEASIERERADAKARGLTLMYEYPFD
jgi:hypothetical protein